ncbi:MAG: T9SS type A sorting domain-containing protein [Ignavibacteria bacterium]|nr:MAG: T9SS type A sorting domain-containing protein [Ignavibacteria bacterium]
MARVLCGKEAVFWTDADRRSSNAANILEAKRLIYRYCIFADRFGTHGNSGLAELNEGAGGNDFMVTLGTFSPISDSLQAGTFMHELGHTLGLRHGGGDDKAYKPNYYSVMSYVWQAPQFGQPYGGLGWTLNYSPVALPSLNENNLNESVGLNPQPGDFPTVIVPFNSTGNVTRVGILNPGTAIDWDGNGDSAGNALAPLDLDYLNQNPPEAPSPGDVLVSYPDWPNLKYNFRGSSKFMDPPAAGPQTAAARDAIEPEEMTPAIYNFLQSLPPHGVAAPLIAWPTDPASNIPISTAPLAQGQPVITGDGSGGAIIAYSWNTAHFSGYGDSVHIYAQRIDSLGGIQWRNNGVPICTVKGAQTWVAITADGAGGAILVWQDTRSGLNNVYAQRVNQWGQPLWTADGVPVTTAANESRPPFPVVTSSGNGGAIIAWRDGHSGTYSVYAQRLDPSGTVQWPAEGALISTSPATVQDFVVQIISDDSGGAIIAWVDQRGGTGSQYYDIYAQKINAAGAVQWALNGIPICTSPDGQYSPRLVGDGSRGAIIAWSDSRDGSSENIYAQHVGSNGQVLWAANGAAVSTGAGVRYFPEIVGDGAGGAVIAWSKRRLPTNYDDIFAQRISASGTVSWTTDGVAISDTGSSSGEVTMVGDNAGGAIIAFSDKRGNGDLNIYAQRVDSSGGARWAKNGVPISSAPRNQWFAMSTSDHAGGAILSWQDNRNENNGGIHHIYAQNVTRDGVLGGGVVTAVKSPSVALPSDFKLYQNYPNPFNPTTTIRYDLPRASHVSLRVYNILGQEVAVLLDDVQGAGVKSVKWNAGRMSSGVYFYRLQAGTFFAVQKMVIIK